MGSSHQAQPLLVSKLFPQNDLFCLFRSCPCICPQVYSSQDQIREKIRTLSSAMQKSVAILPSGNELRISISGGVAWYPANGTDMDTLKKYADFALYQVKRTNKGHLEEFSMEIYQQEAQAAQLRRDFQQLLTEERVYYVFQPIFSARTGKVMAYEALMRSDMEALRSPATIMKLAREQPERRFRLLSIDYTQKFYQVLLSALLKHMEDLQI